MVGQRLGRHSQGSRQIPGGNLPLLQFEQDPSAGFVRQGRQNGRDPHFITTYFKISLIIYSTVPHPRQDYFKLF